MNPMEIISLVVAVLVLLKLVVFLLKPEVLSEAGKNMSKNSKIMILPILILFVIVGYYVFSSLSIIQVFPAILLGHILLALLLFQYPKVYSLMIKEVFKDTSKSWLVWLIWTGLSVWTLYALFM